MSAGELLRDPGAAQRAARAILAERRFHQPSVPRPLHGTLVAIGKVLASPLSAIEKLAGDLAPYSPGGVTGVWVLFALALAAITFGLARRWTRTELRGPQAAQGLASRTQSAADLERAATAAEREGRLEDAVRLRFQAGLTRLGERDAIPSPRTTPTWEVARRLRSPRFDALAQRFDEIAYGHDPADAADVETARREWPAIIDAGPRS